MIELSDCLEGEALVRFLLEARSRAGSTPAPDCLRWKARRLPSPSVPQVLARAGIERLAVEVSPSDFERLKSLVTATCFRWHGIDASTVAVALVTEGLSGDELEGDLPSWYGELPAGGADGTEEDAYIARPPGSQRFRELLASIGARAFPLDIDTRGIKKPVFVWSGMSIYANEVVQTAVFGDERPVAAIGPEGEIEPVQVVRMSAGVTSVLFIPKNVPQHGYAVWDLGGTSVPAAPEDEASASPTHLENDSLRVEFDRDTGLIVSIYDKANEREVLNESFEVKSDGRRRLKLEACANLLTLTRPDGYSAYLTSLESTEATEHGPVRGAIRFTRRLPGGMSSIIQTVRLTSRSMRIDFYTEIDWHDGPCRIKAQFPVAINGRRAAVDVPFGYTERATYGCGSAGASAHRMDRHSWVDFSEGDYGVALMNDSEAPCGVSGPVLQIRLLDADGGPEINDGFSHFTYSLLPHEGDLRDGEVAENAMALCKPPEMSPIAGNKAGTMPLQRSHFEVDSASIFIEAIKPAEQQEGAIVVRLYEAHNTRGTTLLATSLPAIKAWLCDLFENSLAEIPLDHGEAMIPFHPFEIITVKYEL